MEVKFIKCLGYDVYTDIFYSTCRTYYHYNYGRTRENSLDTFLLPNEIVPPFCIQFHIFRYCICVSSLTF